jgi:hypothetical protein
LPLEILTASAQALPSAIITFLAVYVGFHRKLPFAESAMNDCNVPQLASLHSGLGDVDA